jgi:hypothetical protein
MIHQKLQALQILLSFPYYQELESRIFDIIMLKRKRHHDAIPQEAVAMLAIA